MKAHPIVGGTPLLLGDIVVANRGSRFYEHMGEVTDIHVRCWGNHNIEGRYNHTTKEYEPGEEYEQVWVHLDNQNIIYHAEQLERA